MTKLSTLIESLINIINADDKGNICEYINTPYRHSSYCDEILCTDCPFGASNVNHLEKHLKTVKTLELINVDS